MGGEQAGKQPSTMSQPTSMAPRELMAEAVKVSNRKSHCISLASPLQLFLVFPVPLASAHRSPAPPALLLFTGGGRAEGDVGYDAVAFHRTLREARARFPDGGER